MVWIPSSSFTEPPFSTFSELSSGPGMKKVFTQKWNILSWLSKRENKGNARTQKLHLLTRPMQLFQWQAIFGSDASKDTKPREMIGTQVSLSYLRLSTFFSILFCLWKNSTLISPHTGSGCGNSKNMFFSSLLVCVGLEVCIFTFSWYTTNWGSVRKSTATVIPAMRVRILSYRDKKVSQFILEIWKKHTGNSKQLLTVIIKENTN